MWGVGTQKSVVDKKFESGDELSNQELDNSIIEKLFVKNISKSNANLSEIPTGLEKELYTDTYRKISGDVAHEEINCRGI